MGLELAVVVQQLKVARDTCRALGKVAPRGQYPDLHRFVKLDKIRRIAERAAREMAEVVGPEAEELVASRYRNPQQEGAGSCRSR